jgi:hypothetical protein
MLGLLRRCIAETGYAHRGGRAKLKLALGRLLLQVMVVVVVVLLYHFAPR